VAVSSVGFADGAGRVTGRRAVAAHRPIFDRVLNPGSQGRTIQLFKLPYTERFLNLQQLVPSHFQNPWTVVAFALVAATVLKGIFDYIGTYLVNYAGFGMITDLRDDLYNAILRSSSAFFVKHTTGTLLSTIVSDVEKVQFAMSSVLSEFLQQFFTFIFTAAVVVLLGGSWRGCCCCLSGNFVFVEKDRTAGAEHDAGRAGQAG